ncbi:DUF389 domain-containing protein [Agromyces sp. LHK192]|uniref:DUF389 domain-containing protein n=1 Tax=Agromyces sp. LHK192 TaxID=2498704 RepID=UPI000FDA2312|nr:DUF389 domain-containing protein [Agromyces sp. LHK192]
MLHVRLIVPPDLRDAVDAVLRDAVDDVTNHVVHPNAAVSPAGDVVLFDVDRAGASELLGRLRHTGLAASGSISAEHLDLELDRYTTDRDRDDAMGGDDDAVVWEEVEAKTNDEVRLSATFLAFIAIATMIAAVGIVIDQPILIVGAMIVGPEFGPLAAIAVGIVRRRGRVVGRSLATLTIGFAFAVLATVLFGAVLRWAGVFARNPFLEQHPSTSFIWSPDALSWVVAFLAGVAGILSLTSAKSGALIGVLISVTTVPAAGAIAVAATVGAWDIAGTATIQLGINLLSIIVAGVLTLSVQLWAQRLGRERRRVARRRAAES